MYIRYNENNEVTEFKIKTLSKQYTEVEVENIDLFFKYSKYYIYDNGIVRLNPNLRPPKENEYKLEGGEYISFHKQEIFDISDVTIILDEEDLLIPLREQGGYLDGLFSFPESLKETMRWYDDRIIFRDE